jgi:Peptidase family M23
VVNPTSGSPSIASINPISPTTNKADQDVAVIGNNFREGLKVKIVFPNGQDGLLQGSGQIFNLTPTSFTMKITLNGGGQWGMRVVNLDGAESALFNFNVQSTSPAPTGIPSTVLSPVIGPLKMTTTNQGIADGKWEFNQHMTGYHRASGGISGSNDKFAWDVNLYSKTSSNDDAGEPVFAAADGDVVYYAGVAPGAKAGAILIAHPSKDNPVWWSGYLHLKNIKVGLQRVSASTHIGDIGRDGANNDHLHFVLYYGENKRGGLQSFNATITERGSATPSSQAPVVAELNPSAPIAGGDDQNVTVLGNNFQQNLTAYVSFPGGGGKTLSGQQILDIKPNSFVMRVKLNAAGRWSVRVNNPDSSQSSPFSFTVQSSPKPDVTPLIFIPGIAGSRLDKRGGTSLWVGQSVDTNRLELTLDPQHPNFQPEGTILATDALRTDFLIFGQLYRKEIIAYQGLLDMLDDPSQGGIESIR